MNTKLGAMLLFLLVYMLISGCSNQGKPSPTQTEIEWADIIMWDDNKYYYDEVITNSIDDGVVHKELGEVKFTVIGSNEEKNPDYNLKNEEATYAPIGSKIYSIKDEEIYELIFTDGKVYKKP